MLTMFTHKEPDADPGLAGMAMRSTTGRSYKHATAAEGDSTITRVRRPGHALLENVKNLA